MTIPVSLLCSANNPTAQATQDVHLYLESCTVDVLRTTYAQHDLQPVHTVHNENI